MDEYDAGYLSDFGGGNVGWWQDYVRAEIGRANEFCAVQYATLAAENAALKALVAEMVATFDPVGIYAVSVIMDEHGYDGVWLVNKAAKERALIARAKEVTS